MSAVHAIMVRRNVTHSRVNSAPLELRGGSLRENVVDSASQVRDICRVAFAWLGQILQNMNTYNIILCICMCVCVCVCVCACMRARACVCMCACVLHSSHVYMWIDNKRVLVDF